MGLVKFNGTISNDDLSIRLKPSTNNINFIGNIENKALDVQVIENTSKIKFSLIFGKVFGSSGGGDGNSVKVIPQSLTEEQQEIARNNISVYSTNKTEERIGEEIVTALGNINALLKTI